MVSGISSTKEDVHIYKDIQEVWNYIQQSYARIGGTDIVIHRTNPIDSTTNKRGEEVGDETGFHLTKIYNIMGGYSFRICLTLSK